MRSLINSFPTFPATLAKPQSAAVTAGCELVQRGGNNYSVGHWL